MARSPRRNFPWALRSTVAPIFDVDKNKLKKKTR